MCRHVSLCYVGSGDSGWITATFSDLIADCGFYICVASLGLVASGVQLSVFAVSFSLLTLKLLSSPAGGGTQLSGRVSPPLSAELNIIIRPSSDVGI